MFKKGDRFIQFTKYGGVNKGEVEEYTCYNTKIDSINRVRYELPQIVTTNGVYLYLDGSDGQIFKVIEEYTQEQVDSMNKEYRDSMTRLNRFRP